MNIKKQGHLEAVVRLVVSNALQNKMSDPRLHVMSSVTRVELAQDMSSAQVYISVMGTEGQQRGFMRALKGAGGIIQSMVARKLTTRTCPTLKFHLDQSLKKGFETIQKIEQAMAELGQRTGVKDPSDQAGKDDQAPGHEGRGEGLTDGGQDE